MPTKDVGLGEPLAPIHDERDALERLASLRAEQQRTGERDAASGSASGLGADARRRGRFVDGSTRLSIEDFAASLRADDDLLERFDVSLRTFRHVVAERAGDPRALRSYLDSFEPFARASPAKRRELMAAVAMFRSSTRPLPSGLVVTPGRHLLPIARDKAALTGYSPPRSRLLETGQRPLGVRRGAQAERALSPGVASADSFYRSVSANPGLELTFSWMKTDTVSPRSVAQSTAGLRTSPSSMARLDTSVVQFKQVVSDRIEALDSEETFASPLMARASEDQRDGLVDAGEQFFGNAAEHEAQLIAESTSGTPQDLPYRELLQELFHPFDLSPFKAVYGSKVETAQRMLGVQGLATNNTIALSDPNDLWTVAHEVAHLVQQQLGYVPAGGRGEAGDQYEAHADLVADRVVAGEPVAGLFEFIAPSLESSEGVSRTEADRAERLDQRYQSAYLRTLRSLPAGATRQAVERELEARSWQSDRNYRNTFSRLQQEASSTPSVRASSMVQFKRAEESPASKKRFYRKVGPIVVRVLPGALSILGIRALRVSGPDTLSVKQVPGYRAVKVRVTAVDAGSDLMNVEKLGKALHELGWTVRIEFAFTTKADRPGGVQNAWLVGPRNPAPEAKSNIDKPAKGEEGGGSDKTPPKAKDQKKDEEKADEPTAPTKKRRRKLPGLPPLGKLLKGRTEDAAKRALGPALDRFYEQRKARENQGPTHSAVWWLFEHHMKGSSLAAELLVAQNNGPLAMPREKWAKHPLRKRLYQGHLLAALFVEKVERHLRRIHKASPDDRTKLNERLTKLYAEIRGAVGPVLDEVMELDAATTNTERLEELRTSKTTVPPQEGKVADAWQALDRVKQVLRTRDNQGVITAEHIPRLQHELNWVYAWLTFHTSSHRRREMMGGYWSPGNDGVMSGMFSLARASAGTLARGFVHKLEDGGTYRWRRSIQAHLSHRIKKVQMCEEYLRIMTGELAPEKSRLFQAVDAAWAGPLKAVLLAVELSPIGDLLEVAKAALHVATGDFEAAGISLAAAIPLIGDGVKLGRWGVRSGRIVEGIGQRAVRFGKHVSPVRVQMAMAYGKKVYQKAADKLGELNIDDALDAAMDRMAGGKKGVRAGRIGKSGGTKKAGAGGGNSGGSGGGGKKKKKGRKKGGDPVKAAAIAAAKETYRRVSKDLTPDGVSSENKLKKIVESGHTAAAATQASRASGGLAELKKVGTSVTPRSNSWAVVAKAKPTTEGKKQGHKRERQATHGSRGWIVFTGRSSGAIYLPAKNQGTQQIKQRLEQDLKGELGKQPKADKTWKEVFADKKKRATELQKKEGWSQTWSKKVAYSIRLPNQKEAEEQFASKGSGGRVTALLRFGVKAKGDTLKKTSTAGLVQAEGKVPLAPFGASPILVEALKKHDVVEGFLVPLVKGKPVTVKVGSKSHAISRTRLTNDATDELSLKRRDGRGQRANLELIKRRLVAGAKRKERHEWIPRSTVEHLINASKDWPGVAKGAAWIRALDELRSLTKEVIFKPDWASVEAAIEAANDKGEKTLRAWELKLFSGHEGAISVGGKSLTKGSAAFHRELIDNVEITSGMTVGSIDACLDGVMTIFGKHCWNGLLSDDAEDEGGDLRLDFAPGLTLAAWARQVRQARIDLASTVKQLKAKYDY